MPRRRSGRPAPHRGTRRGPPCLVHRRALGAANEAFDLLVGESSEAANVLGDGDGHLLVMAVATRASQVEALVDGFLKLDGPAPPLRIVTGELGEPAGAHAHMGDLIGE